MIDSAVITYAETYSPACKFELDAAFARFENNLYTESIMRLGRAVEAAIYSTSIIMDISILHKGIETLCKVSNEIRKAEILLMRSNSVSDVKNLANISKFLSEGIALLASSEEFRRGSQTDRVRSNLDLLRDVKNSLQDGFAKRRIAQIEETLEEIQIFRNMGAHADKDGKISEFEQSEVISAFNLVNSFLVELFEVTIGYVAQKTLRNCALHLA